MRGHLQIIAMRKAGRRPSEFVFVSTDPVNEALRLDRWDEEGMSPHVVIDQADAISRLDFRWAVGLTAFVYGEDAERVAAAASGLIAIGARRVIATVGREVVRDTIREGDTACA